MRLAITTLVELKYTENTDGDNGLTKKAIDDWKFNDKDLALLTPAKNNVARRCSSIGSSKRMKISENIHSF